MRFASALSPRIFAAGFVLLLAACVSAPEKAPEKLTLTPVTYRDLPGWVGDHISKILPALNVSCAKNAAKKDWLAACAIARMLPPDNDNLARDFFQTRFQPYAVSGADGGEGLFTGYYEAELRGALKKTARYHVPLYARPRDLITADLGDFKSEWKGQHITGKVEKNKFIPYDDRAAITRGALKDRAQVLLWVDDDADAFFLAVQGSGRVRMVDGKTIRLGYDGANGRAYVAIGRALADMNEIGKPVTMAAIRTWLAQHPARAGEVMNKNPSYVFFREIDGEGPIGAEGVALTPQRSLAVDPAFIALGTPVWLDTADGKGVKFQHLMMAQDTGGAIKGAVRGDVFWGYGADAEAQAGAMQSRGHYYILLPKKDAGL